MTYEVVKQHLTHELGFEVSEFTPLSITAYNSHFRLMLDGRRSHLVLYNLPESLPIMGIKFEHAIMRYLADRGYREVPSLIERGGQTLFRVANYYYALTEWIDDCHLEPDRVISAEQRDDAARALADLHRCIAGLDLTLNYFPEHIFVYPTSAFLDAHAMLLDGLQTRSGNAEHFDAEARQQIAEFIPLARDFIHSFDRTLYNKVRAADPTNIVHGDFRKMNLVFGQDGVHKVLDFNCCFNDIRLWDLSYTALSFGGKETVGPLQDPNEAAAFIRAYHRHSPLSDHEWSLLPDFLSFVFVKLMTAATSSWWINEKFSSLRELLTGQAKYIRDRAQSQD